MFLTPPTINWCTPSGTHTPLWETIITCQHLEWMNSTWLSKAPLTYKPIKASGKYHQNSSPSAFRKLPGSQQWNNSQCEVFIWKQQSARATALVVRNVHNPNLTQHAYFFPFTYKNIQGTRQNNLLVHIQHQNTKTSSVLRRVNLGVTWIWILSPGDAETIKKYELALKYTLLSK